jgi:hypothetical protein
VRCNTIELSSDRLILCASTMALTWPQAIAWPSDPRDTGLFEAFVSTLDGLISYSQFREVIVVCGTLQVVVLDAM